MIVSDKKISKKNFVFQIGIANEIEHLSSGTFASPAFPVTGTIHGRNIRYMVPLICQRAGKQNSKAITFWFLMQARQTRRPYSSGSWWTPVRPLPALAPSRWKVSLAKAISLIPSSNWPFKYVFFFIDSLLINSICSGPGEHYRVPSFQGPFPRSQYSWGGCHEKIEVVDRCGLGEGNVQAHKTINVRSFIFTRIPD